MLMTYQKPKMRKCEVCGAEIVADGTAPCCATPKCLTSYFNKRVRTAGKPLEFSEN